MSFSIIGFAIGQTLAQQAGVDSGRAAQLGLIHGVLGMSTLNSILIQEVARRQAGIGLLPPPVVVAPPDDTVCQEARDAALQAHDAALQAHDAALQARDAAARAAAEAGRAAGAATETQALLSAHAGVFEEHKVRTEVFNEEILRAFGAHQDRTDSNHSQILRAVEDAAAAAQRAEAIAQACLEAIRALK